MQIRVNHLLITCTWQLIAVNMGAGKKYTEICG